MSPFLLSLKIKQKLFCTLIIFVVYTFHFKELTKNNCFAIHMNIYASIYQLNRHSQTNNSLYEWICFAYGSGVETIHDVVCRNKAIEANCEPCILCRVIFLAMAYWEMLIQPTHVLAVQKAFVTLIGCLSSILSQFCLCSLALPSEMKSSCFNLIILI